MKSIFTIISFFVFTCFTANAQNVPTKKDSVIQLYGVIMTADSLQALPNVSVVVVGRGRGTITNASGVFSIAVLKGDEISFMSVGFKDKTIKIPTNLEGDEYSCIQLLVNDTTFLPATIIKSRPTREQFERDFSSQVNADDAYEIARKNNDENKLRAIMATLPADGREAINTQFRQQAVKYYSIGQIPPQNIFSPLAWASFVQAWKRGDFKRKK